MFDIGASNLRTFLLKSIDYDRDYQYGLISESHRVNTFFILTVFNHIMVSSLYEADTLGTMSGGHEVEF